MRGGGSERESRRVKGGHESERSGGVAYFRVVICVSLRMVASTLTPLSRILFAERLRY